MRSGPQMMLFVVVLMFVAVLVAAKMVMTYQQAAPTETAGAVPSPSMPGQVADASEPGVKTATDGEEADLPRLIELGSTTCIPCQKMAPILDQLTTDLEGRVHVEFIDIYKDTTASDKYGIKIIPTQVFLGADGRELFRHEGFYARADILAKMREVRMLKE